MGFTEPDSPPPPQGVPQMPQAGAGPAPVPYSGPNELGQVYYAATGVSFATPAAEVLAPAEGGPLQESAYAHDINAGLVMNYVAGSPSPIGVHGDADAGGRDVVAGTAAGAVTAAEAAFLEQEGDTHGAGSTIGDLLTLPPGPVDPGAAPGEALPTAAYYDPPRSY